MSGVLSDRLENSVDATRGQPLAARVLARKDELEDALAELGPHDASRAAGDRDRARDRVSLMTGTWRIRRRSSRATSTAGSSATSTSRRTSPAASDARLAQARAVAGGDNGRAVGAGPARSRVTLPRALVPEAHGGHGGKNVHRARCSSSIAAAIATRSPPLLGPHLIRLRPAITPARGSRRYAPRRRAARAPCAGSGPARQPRRARHVQGGRSASTRLERAGASSRSTSARSTRSTSSSTIAPSRCRSPTPTSSAPTSPPFLDTRRSGVRTAARASSASSPSCRAAGDTVDSLVALNARGAASAIRYVIREEAGIWTPEETLAARAAGAAATRRCCSSPLLRSRGLAARFV